MKQPEWTRQADQWCRIGSPLRPGPEDTALTAELAAPVLMDVDRPSVAILGVTPELVQLPWPAATRIIAVDSSANMIASVWAPHPARASAVVRARWQEMPLEAGCLDAAVGDGCLNVLHSTQIYDQVLGEVARALKPSGRLILRCFVRADPSETVEQVLAATMAGEISTFHAMKWRLAMAIPVDHDFQLPLRRVYAVFSELFPDRTRLAEATNWSQGTIGTIDVYASTDISFNFPSLATMLRHASRWFELVDVKYGTYEMAERCPTVCLAVRSSPQGPVT
jgi:SAM-dependent methyltransferase